MLDGFNCATSRLHEAKARSNVNFDPACWSERATQVLKMGMIWFRAGIGTPVDLLLWTATVSLRKQQKSEPFAEVKYPLRASFYCLYS